MDSNASQPSNCYLTAAKHYAQEIGHESASKNITRYIMNGDTELMSEPEVEQFKIWPPQANRKMFIDIVASNDRAEIKGKYSQYWYKNEKRDQIREFKTVPNLLGAYGYFYDQIKQAVETDDLSPDLDEIREVDTEAVKEFSDVNKKNKLDAIWTALLEEFKVVHIVLDEGDDAHVIFETLNDRGEPLLASALVKNNIFQRADAREENAEELFEKYWKPFDDIFWRQEDKQGRYKKERIELFLANFVAAKSAHDVTISKLFSEYKSFLKPKKGTAPRYSSVEKEIIELCKYGSIYREFIERSSDSALAKLSKRLRLWDVTTANPLILRIWESEILEMEEKVAAFDLLLSLIVRRAVCDLRTKNYNNLFLSAIAKLDRTEWSLQNLQSFFLEQTSSSGRFPRDEEFRNALVEKPIYSMLNSPKTRAILIGIEGALNTGNQELQGLKEGLSVEHVLPQRWREYWLMMDGVSANE